MRALFDPLMEAAASDGAALDWKTALQELTAARGLGVPEYAITESGPDHAKSFVATAVVAGDEPRRGCRAQQEGGRAAGRRGRLASLNGSNGADAGRLEG